MGQALYRKYRPQSIDEVVGQPHITTTLTNALKEGRMSHAYLFTGPRGTGKTSVARLLALAINDLPYDGETQPLDIIEIDAASNNGVEDVRDLREKVRLAPTSAKFKVYIIDEVHMLSGAAFNALLKTLEEPPTHVVFILATTDAHKLPATIISRTQRFQFRPIAQDQVAAHLKEIAKKESIAIDDDALALIAEHGDGTFRDSISLLDQLANVGKKETISVAAIEATLGVAPKTAITGLISLLQKTDITAMVKAYETLLSGGVTPAALATQLMHALRTQAAAQPAVYALIDQLIDVPRAYNPQLKLEVVLAKYMLQNNPNLNKTSTPKNDNKKDGVAQKTTHSKTTTSTIKSSSAAASVTNPEAVPPKEALESVSSSITPPQSTALDSPTPNALSEQSQAAAKEFGSQVASEVDVPRSVSAKTATITPGSTKLGELSDAQWEAIVTATKAEGPTLHTVIRQAIPYFDVEKQLLTLTFRFPLHQKRIEEQRLKQVFFKVLQATLGSVPEMQVVLNKNAVRHIPPATPATPQPTDETLPSDPSTATVMSVMGGGEVVNA